uniref:Uncharacterized protein n=1 Tax=Glossina austeni TaxID=7395 RepID=A0A1A9UY30_GLOAU
MVGISRRRYDEVEEPVLYDVISSIVYIFVLMPECDFYTKCLSESILKQRGKKGLKSQSVVISSEWMPINKPRAATSVATSILDLPERNSRKTKSRSDCDLSPWMAPQRTPKLLNTRRTMNHEPFMSPLLTLSPYHFHRKFQSLDILGITTAATSISAAIASTYTFNTILFNASLSYAVVITTASSFITTGATVSASTAAAATATAAVITPTTATTAISFVMRSPKLEKKGKKDGGSIIITPFLFFLFYIADRDNLLFTDMSGITQSHTIIE